MKYTAIIEDTEKNTTIFEETYNDIDHCLNRLMCTIYADIGNGGMSAEKKDGSIGSFWRCADEVYDVLRNGGIEYYADRKFYIRMEEDAPKKEVKYVFRFSTVLDTSVEMSGETYEDAWKKAKTWVNDQMRGLDDEMRTTCTEWKPSGDWNSEGDTVIQD